jgi:hypothetical protein
MWSPEDYYEELQDEEVDQCPICSCVISEEEFKENHGLCHPCRDKMERKIMYGEE